MKVESGDRIKILEDCYDVLNVMEEIDSFDSEKNRAVGEHTAIELHKDGNRKIQFTHVLKLYYNNEIKLCEIPYSKEKKLKMEDIKILESDKK